VRLSVNFAALIILHLVNEGMSKRTEVGQSHIHPSFPRKGEKCGCLWSFRSTNTHILLGFEGMHHQNMAICNRPKGGGAFQVGGEL